MSIRKLLTLFCIFVMPILLIAQKGNSPSQTDTDKRIKQAQQDFEKLTPEQKKMMEQMGIKIPVIPSPELNAGSNSSGFAPGNTPPKDLVRIKKIPTAPLTDASLSAYISTTHTFVLSRLQPAAASLGEKLYQDLRSKKSTPSVTGNTAAGLWILGRVQPALYLMGKALQDDPANTDNQNNYAAMLTMSSGEPQAIPLLNKLNKQYPGNTTILNNLGQAWFNLGDLQKADQYLDSCIKLNRRHPQAAMTKAAIEESKGHKDKAVELIKDAMEQTLSMDKENQLRKLGYKLTYNDLSFPFKKNPDPLGLSGFKHPAFPKTSAEEIVLRKEWAQFYNEVLEKSLQLQQELNGLRSPSKNIEEAKAVQDYYLNNGPQPELKEERPMSFARRARLKLALMDKDGGMKFRLDKSLKDLNAHHTKMKPEHLSYQKAYQILDRQHAFQVGEGKANKDYCQQFNGLADKYLSTWNEGHEALYDEYLQQLRLKLSEEIFWLQFIKTPDEFNVTRIQYQLQWLRGLMAVSYKEIGDVTTFESCFNDSPERKGKFGKLAQFNEIHCLYHSELNLGVGTIVSSCNKMITSLEIGPVKLGLTQDMDKNNFMDQFLNFNAEFSAGKSESVKLGPLTAEIGVKGTIGIEVGRSGIQDVYVAGSAGAGVKTNGLGQLEEAGYPAEMGGIGVSDKTLINVSTGGRISLISGKGSFNGMEMDLLK
jgi:Flp pilus assembly protein TadD